MKTPEAVPELNSKPLLLARPISNTVPSLFVNSVPLVECAVSTNLTFLYTSVSPETNPTSGVPKTLLIFTNGSCKNLVVIPLSVSNSLAFARSIKVVPNFSTSYPRTYAFPWENPNANKSSEAVLPWDVVAPEAYIPLLFAWIKFSLTSKSKLSIV